MRKIKEFTLSLREPPRVELLKVLEPCDGKQKQTAEILKNHIHVTI